MLKSFKKMLIEILPILIKLAQLTKLINIQAIVETLSELF